MALQSDTAQAVNQDDPWLITETPAGSLNDETNEDTSPDDPWLIAETDYPVHGTVEEQLAFLVGYAILAPSRYNCQPWSFTLRDTVMELRLDPARLLPVTDSRGREAVMNCGTALYYLRIAMRYFGHTPVVELLPGSADANLLARIRQGEASAPTEEVQALFHGIRHRRTYEESFRPDPIPAEVFHSLHAIASEEGTALVFLEEEEHRQSVAEMVVEGERILQQNPGYRQEAETWTEESGKENWFSSLISQVWETFTSQQIESELVLEAPALAVLGTEGDRPQDWIAAGQALGAILLTADTAWVEASFLNQPIEVLSIRPRLQQLVEGIVPQLILRLGLMKGHYLPHKPRRTATEVLHTGSDMQASEEVASGQMRPLILPDDSIVP